MGLHANGLTVDMFSWVPCNWFTSAAYDGDGQRHTYVKKEKKYKWDEPGMNEIFDDLSRHVEFIQEGGKMVFTDLEVAEKFKSIFEDMAVADLRVALLWAAGDDECNRHVIRHYHKKGEPHKAIEYCLDQVETRLANGGTFLHDTIKTHGALTTQLLAELQRLAAAAPGDAAAEGQTDETGAATPSTATSTSHFIPGTMKTNIGTLKSMIEFLRAQGDKPQVLFSFEAETGDESLETIEVRMPTLKNVCAPWADRKLSGPESFAALACDTALVLVAAPDAMFYLPPRINDIYFWSTNQRPWLDVMILDEFIYQIDPHCSLFLTGDKPKDDCVMGPSVPGEVRQNRSHVLLNKTKLLGVGFKSDNQKYSGQAKFHGKTLADEIKALRGRHHVTVLAKQEPNSQAPPEFCVVTPLEVEQFAKVARMGADTTVSYYQLKQRTNLKFVPVADAAQQLVEAYEKYSRFASRARERRGRVVTSSTQAPVFPGLPRRDGRHRRLARQEPGRARRGGAPLGPGRVLRALVPGRRQGPVRDYLQVPLPGSGAGPHGPHRLLRVHGQFDGPRGVGVDRSRQQHRVGRRLRRDVGQHGRHLGALLPREEARHVAARRRVLDDGGAAGAERVLAPHPWGGSAGA